MYLAMLPARTRRKGLKLITGLIRAATDNAMQAMRTTPEAMCPGRQ